MREDARVRRERPAKHKRAPDALVRFGREGRNVVQRSRATLIKAADEDVLARHTVASRNIVDRSCNGSGCCVARSRVLTRGVGRAMTHVEPRGRLRARRERAAAARRGRIVHAHARGCERGLELAPPHKVVVELSAARTRRVARVVQEDDRALRGAVLLVVVVAVAVPRQVVGTVNVSYCAAALSTRGRDARIGCGRRAAREPAGAHARRQWRERRIEQPRLLRSGRRRRSLSALGRAPRQQVAAKPRAVLLGALILR